MPTFCVGIFYIKQMRLSDCFKIGFILKPHGLKGEVTVSLEETAPESFEEVEAVFLERNGQLIPYFLEAISLKGDKAYVKFEDINDVDSANEICKSPMMLPKTARAKSGKGEFYDDEIVGFEVIDSEQGSLGLVTEVTQAGPNKLLSIQNGEKELLIPVNGPFIKGINKSKRKISVELPEGFLDI